MITALEKITIRHESVRVLSGEGVSVRNVKLSQLKAVKEQTTRLLFVMVFDTLDELQTFQTVTKDFHMSYAIWLIFFAGDANQDVCEFCRKSPHDQLSNPEIDSTVLTSCCDPNIIEKWRHIGNNRTDEQEIGRLTDENFEIVGLSVELVKSHRYKQMNGKELRIAVLEVNIL